MPNSWDTFKNITKEKETKALNCHAFDLTQKVLSPGRL
jgi:hypothetical protein